MSQKPRFRGPVHKEHGKRVQTLFKPASQHLYCIYWSLSRRMIWKKSLLLNCQILGPLVNTLTANDKYPVLNRDNLKIPIQKQLSQKQKPFLEFFSAFLKARLNFQRFEIKDDRHRFCISEIMDS